MEECKMEYAEKIDIAKGTDELRKLILENPTLPIVILTDYEVVADEGGYWYGNNIKYAIKDLLTVKSACCDDDRIIDDRSDLEDLLSDRMCEEEWTEGLSDEEYNNAVQRKMQEYEPLWTRCICIYSTT